MHMQLQTSRTPTAIPVVVRMVVLGLALLVIGIFAARQAGLEVRQPDAPVVWKKDLRFADGEHGEILVFDSASQKIASFEGEQGFLRGTLRALARERKKRSIRPRCELLSSAAMRMDKWFYVTPPREKRSISHRLDPAMHRSTASCNKYTGEDYVNRHQPD
jgi:hypothetical protein